MSNVEFAILDDGLKRITQAALSPLAVSHLAAFPPRTLTRFNTPAGVTPLFIPPGQPVGSDTKPRETAVGKTASMVAD